MIKMIISLGLLLSISLFAGAHEDAADEYDRDNKKQAAVLFKKACVNGEVWGLGCNALATQYLRGEGVDQDIPRAVKLFTKSCAENVQQSCIVLGRLYYNGQIDIKQDKMKALELFEKACEARYQEACVYAGYMYMQGDAVRQDKMRAKKLFTQACEGNQAEACNKLGLIHVQHMAEQEKLMAKEFFGTACNNGSIEGCKNYKILNEEGY